MELAFAAVIPIVLAILLGYAAGWHHDETPSTAKAINLMVLHYALPLSLFAAMVATPREELLKQGPLALVLLVGMVVPYALYFAVQYKMTAGDMSASVLRAMGFGLPAIPFLGITILTPFIGPAASVAVSIGSCIINFLIVPATFVLLALGSRKAPGKADPAAAPGNKRVDDGQTVKPNQPPENFGKVILDTIKEPVVWVPVCGLILVFCGVSVPKQVLGAVQFLGGTSGAVALFASGIILQAQKPTISWSIVTSTLARNLVIPGIALLVLRLLHVAPELQKTAVLALAIPAGAMQITLALRYGTKEQENASFLLYSNVLSILSISAFALILK